MIIRCLIQDHAGLSFVEFSLATKQPIWRLLLGSDRSCSFLYYCRPFIDTAMATSKILFFGHRPKRPSKLTLSVYQHIGKKALPENWRPVTSYSFDRTDNSDRWMWFQRTNCTELDVDHIADPSARQARDLVNKQHQFVADALNQNPSVFNFIFQATENDWMVIRIGENELELYFDGKEWKLDYSYIPRSEEWAHWLIGEGTIQLT